MNANDLTNQIVDLFDNNLVNIYIVDRQMNRVDF